MFVSLFVLFRLHFITRMTIYQLIIWDIIINNNNNNNNNIWVSEVGRTDHCLGATSAEVDMLRYVIQVRM